MDQFGGQLSWMWRSHPCRFGRVDCRSGAARTPEQVAYFEQLRSWGYSLSDAETLVVPAGKADRHASDTPIDNSDRVAS